MKSSDLKKDQIKLVFIDLEKLLTSGVWMSAVEEEGEYKRYQGNGRLFIHGFYKKGKRDSEYKQWRFNGEIEIHSLYKDGKEIKNYIK